MNKEYCISLYRLGEIIFDWFVTYTDYFKFFIESILKQLLNDEWTYEREKTMKLMYV